MSMANGGKTAQRSRQRAVTVELGKEEGRTVARCEGAAYKGLIYV